jgi:hypothetical protein
VTPLAEGFIERSRKVAWSTTPEFAWRGLTASPLSGVTVNPLDHALSPGGSSGSAAAATALGLGIIGRSWVVRVRNCGAAAVAGAHGAARPVNTSVIQ